MYLKNLTNELKMRYLSPVGAEKVSKLIDENKEINEEILLNNRLQVTMSNFTYSKKTNSEKVQEDTPNYTDYPKNMCWYCNKYFDDVKTHMIECQIIWKQMNNNGNPMGNN